MLNKKLSIISVLMNNQETLVKMKESVERQTFKDYEHIFCISKKSTDKTNEILIKKIKDSDKIIYEKKTTKNKFDAINQALNFSKGKFIFLLHGDDYLANKNFFANIFREIDKNNNKCIFYTDINIVNSKGEIFRKWISKQENKLSLSNIWNIPHTGMIIDRSKINKKDLYYNDDFFISGDLLYIMNLYQKYSQSFKKIPFVSSHMLNTGDSSKIQNIFKQLKQDAIILKKFFPFKYIFILLNKKLSKVSQFF